MTLHNVQRVSLIADAEEPTTVTRNAFDATAERHTSEGSPPLPKATRIAERLRKPWDEVLTIAHEPPEKHRHLLASRFDQHGGWESVRREAHERRDSG